MKKSVIILIAIIYVASIALVSFFGLKYKVFEEVIPVESVEILDDLAPGNENLGCDYIKYIDLDENKVARYQIKYRVHPDNATNQDVDFILTPVNSGDPNIHASVDENGVVTIDLSESSSVAGGVIVSVIARDATGENSEISILVLAKPKG